MKITKRQLRRIIKEEKAKIAEVSAEQAARINAEQSGLQMQNAGILRADYIVDLMYDDLRDLAGGSRLTPEMWSKFESAVEYAVQQLRAELM